MAFKKLALTPFAHYLGLARAEAPKETDDERAQREGESDEDYAKRMEEMDEEEEQAKRAEEEEKRKEEEAKRAEEERKEEEARRAQENEDEKEKAAAARMKDRCARIVAEGFKMNRPKQAASLAFDTDLTAEQAVSVLRAAAAEEPKAPVAARRPSIDERMAAVKTPNPGADAGIVKPAGQALADRIVAAGEKIKR